MYHHMVESVQNMDIGLSFNNCSDDDSNEDEGDTEDIHTAKPLRKGKIYKPNRSSPRACAKKRG